MGGGGVAPRPGSMQWFLGLQGAMGGTTVVQPAVAEGDVDMVLQVLPHLHRPAVCADLQLTGSVEISIERGLAGLIELAPVPPPVAAGGSNSSGGGGSSAASAGAADSDVDSDDSDAINAMVAAVDPDNKFALFQARKQAMLRRARRDYKRKRRAAAAAAR